ncbi:MAG TPA: 4Fe-4S dicluster domain-containing protein [Anaerolineales bacterium]
MSYTHQIQTQARDLLASGQVNCVIGYEVGPRGRTRPAFVYDPEQVERLVWNQACTHNLAVYLNDQFKFPTHSGSKNEQGGPKKVAVVVKPCDSRAVNVMLAENRFQREQVHLIGVVCNGILEGAGIAGNQRSAHQLPKQDAHCYQARCQRCQEHKPVVYDTLIAEPSPGEKLDLNNAGDDELMRLEALSDAERAEFWLAQFDRCIRCYACRQACPMCDCPTCLYERDDSLWVSMSIGVNEVRAFHLGRAYHLAGRCVGCNECERVCPMDIPISLLNRKLAQEVQAAFDLRPGMVPVPSPLVTVLPEH